MKPETFANLVSVILYEKRFGPYFCQPVVAGLGEDDKPYICTMDSIGAKNQRSYLRQFLKHCNQQLIVIAWLVGEDMSLSFCLYAKAPDDHPCSKLCADVKLGTAQRVLDSNLQSLDHELRYSKS